MKYDFKGNKKTDIKYNYNITANLVGTVKSNDDTDKEVWNRNFILHENTYNKENIDEFSINQQVNIDYEYYNNLARSYEKTYDITIDNILKVRFNISYTINLTAIGSNNEKVYDFIELNIPITSTVSEVKENYKNVTSKKIYNHNLKRIFKYYRELIVTVTNKPNFTNLKTMSVSILDDLIDIAEQTQTNIIHYQEINNEKNIFYVIVDNYVYIYEFTLDN